MKKKYTLIVLTLFLINCVIAQDEYKYPCGAYFISMEPRSGINSTWSNCYTSGDFTLSAWIQLREEEWGRKVMHLFQREIAKFPSYDGLNFYLATDGILKFSTYIMKEGTAVLDSISSGIRPEPFKWHHIALSFEAAGNCKMYINGIQVAAGSFGGPRVVVASNSSIVIGGITVFSGAGGGTYKGYIDEVAFCAKALTKEQIDVLANGLSAGDPFFSANAVAVYQKNDAQNTVNSATGGRDGGIRGQIIACPVDNRPPVANAGADQVINLPTNAVTLNGNMSKDPEGAALTFTWTKLSGPLGDESIIVNPNSMITAVTGIKEGEYVFQLTVKDDKGSEGIDNVLIRVNPELKIKLIDPFPNMIDQDHIHSNIADMDTNNVVKGVAADGISKLIIYIKSEKELKISIIEPSASKGSLSYIDSETIKESTLTLMPKDGVIVLVYNSPDGYGFEHALPTRFVDIKATSLNDPSEEATTSIKIMPPPIVLVHGMWSSPAVWQEGGTLFKLYDAGFSNIQLADYESHNFRTFNPLDAESLPGKTAILMAITKGILKYREMGIVSSQVDILGHSLGGLMARSFSQWEKKNIQPRNYMQGYIHKLITLGTPHGGSPFGPELYNQVTKVRISNALFSKIDVPTKLFFTYSSMRVGSCHRDFNPNISQNPAYLNLKPTYETKIRKVHALTGVWQTDALGSLATMRTACILLFKKSYDAIFNNDLQTDIIVKLKSQLGGLELSSRYVSLYPNTTHSTISPLNLSETNNPQIHQTIKGILQTNSNESFANYFPSPLLVAQRQSSDDNKAFDQEALISKKQQKKVNIKSEENQLIKIDKESRGVFLQPNQSEIDIKFNVIGADKVTNAICIVENIGWFLFDSLPPYSVKVNVPSSLSRFGRFNYFVLAQDSLGALLGDTSYFSTSPIGNFTKLAVEPTFLEIDSVFREIPLNPILYFFNGTDTIAYSIKNISDGISYTSSKGIAAINTRGVVTAISPGNDMIRISYKNMSVDVPVYIDASVSSIAKEASLINFSMEDKILEDDPFLLSAFSSSGEEINYTLVNGPIELQNGIVTIKDTGLVTIRASAPGNAYFNAPPDVVRTFKILPNLQIQTLTFNPITAQTFGNPPVPLNASSSSNLPVTYIVASGPGEIKGDSLVIKGAGEIVVKAIQEGNSNYNPVSVEQTIIVEKAAPTLVLDAATNTIYGNPPVPLNASSSSNLPVTYTIVSGPGEIKGDSLVIIGAGAIVVKAIQEGNSNYNPVSVEQTIIVEKASPTLVLDIATNTIYGNPPIPLNASSSSKLPITYTVISGPGEFKGDSLVITGAGEIVVKAVQGGNDNYNPASAEQTIVVEKAIQTLVMDAADNKTYGDPPILLNAVTNSTMQVIYSVVSGPGEIKGDSLVITGAGEIVIKAVQEGSSNYEPASAEQIILIAKANQTLSLDSIASPVEPNTVVALTGTASSGLPVQYEVVSGPASISGSSLLTTDAGIVVIRASQSGNSNYKPADVIQYSFCATVSQPVTINGDTLSCSRTLTYFIKAKWGTNYRWNVSGNATMRVISDTSITIVYAEAGYYSISATPVNVCSSPVEALNVRIMQAPIKPAVTLVNGLLLRSDTEQGNQWFINGTIIPGAIRQQYTPQQTGDYSVQITANGCTSLMSDIYHFTAIDIPASDTSLLENAITLFPNPFDHTLKVLNKRSTPVGLRLYDITGRDVLYTEIKPGLHEVPTGHLQRGVYIALLINLKEGTWARKILLKL